MTTILYFPSFPFPTTIKEPWPLVHSSLFPTLIVTPGPYRNAAPMKYGQMIKASTDCQNVKPR